MFIAAETVDPATAGRQVDVPALRPGQAPIGAQALALKVEHVAGGIGQCGRCSHAVAIELNLVCATHQSHTLGMPAGALQGQDRRALEVTGAMAGRVQRQVVGLRLA
ncbi:hypothetical protein D3C81_1460720 [compost metagenome]